MTAEQELRQRGDRRREVVRFFELCLASAPFLRLRSHQQKWKGPAWAHRLVTRETVKAAGDWTVNEMSGVEAYVSAEHPVRYFDGIAAAVNLPASASVDLAFFPVQPSLAVAHGDSLQAVWLLHGEQGRCDARSLSQALARRLGGRAGVRLRVPGTEHRSEALPAKLVLVHEAPYALGDFKAALARKSVPKRGAAAPASAGPSKAGLAAASGDRTW
jgi:hypothetical protein